MFHFFKCSRYYAMKSNLIEMEAPYTKYFPQAVFKDANPCIFSALRRATKILSKHLIFKKYFASARSRREMENEPVLF